MTNAIETWRLPAEWEAQDAVLVAWPHEATDWAPWLPGVESTYIALVQAILQRATCLILVRDEQLAERALRLIDRPQALADQRLRTSIFDYDDTWLRDTGPITLVKGHARRWLDFRFTGWGGKYQAQKDDKIVEHLASLASFAHVARVVVDFALEGGAIDADGAGRVLSTWSCLGRRHPQAERAPLLASLAGSLAAREIVLLEHGELDGDDTDGHIDTLVRFCAVDRLVYQGCEDPEDTHFAELAAMAAELAQLRTTAGLPYQIHALPWAPCVHAADGRRLAASYANFLILNGAVLMPTYDLETDVPAAMVLAAAFPDHEIVAVPCRALIEQNGSLHCITMQLPAGVLLEP